MTEFKDALWLSAEKWVDSFPTEIPKHKFSKKHNKIMNEIIYQNQKNSKPKLTKRTVKILLIAAVLLAFATTVFAIPVSREYIIKKFNNYSSYSISNTDKSYKIDSLNVNYIPKGFTLSEEIKADYAYGSSYEKDDLYFSVDKYSINTQVDFDTEKYESENILINNINAVLFKANENNTGIIFNNGKYIFVISGNIEKEELVKIAQNVE